MKNTTEIYVTKINETIENAAKANEKIFPIFVEAFEELDKKNFKVFYDGVNYEKSSKRKMRSICKNPTIIKNLDNLPKGWGTLYEMSKIDESTLVELIGDGTISSTTTCKEVVEIRGENEYVKTDKNGLNSNGQDIIKSQGKKPYTIKFNLKKDRIIEDVLNDDDYKFAVEILSDYFDIEVISSILVEVKEAA